MPRACSIDGCMRPHEARGLCALHYQRWRRNGDPTVKARNISGIVGDDEKRFWYFVDRRGPEDCWLWTGTRSSGGYGLLGIGDHKVRAHRYSYELNAGPIPAGFEIDHVWRQGCRSRACVNPAHLEAVTKSENTRRMSHREHCKRGHLWSEHGYVRPDGRGRQCAACQRERRAEREGR